MPVTTTTDGANLVGKSKPKLMANTTGHIVLVWTDNSATTIQHPTDGTKVGEHIPNLALSSYVDFVGKVTLENAE